MMSDMGADFHQKADCKLAHDLCAVSRNIDDGDSSLPGCRTVDNVVAGRQHSDQFQLRAGVQSLGGNRGLIDHGDFRVADPLRYDGSICVGSAVVDRHLAESFQSAPGQVSGVLGITIKYYNSHFLSSCSFCLPLLRIPSQESDSAFNESAFPAGDGPVLINQPSLPVTVLF